MIFRQNVRYFKLHAFPEWRHLHKLILFFNADGLLGKLVNLQLVLVRKECFNRWLSVLKNVWYATYYWLLFSFIDNWIDFFNLPILHCSNLWLLISRMTFTLTISLHGLHTFIKPFLLTCRFEKPIWLLFLDCWTAKQHFRIYLLIVIRRR